MIGTVPKQKITSSGASAVWWPNDLVHFPANVQTKSGDFLFSSEGLYLSSYRYYMGGDGGNDTKTVTYWGSTIVSFLLRSGTYEYCGDHAGIKFMKMAQAWTAPYITFFINAAPSHITKNYAA